MRTASMPDPTAGGLRRSPSLRRSVRLTPLLPSQDVSRYQATNMPPPTFDLDRKEPSALLRALLVPALVIAATGGVVALIQRIGTWLAP